MKMSKIINMTMIICFCNLQVLYAGTTFKQEIKIQGNNNFKSIQLTNDVYNNCDNGLRSLRIMDDKGNYLPYFINNQSAVTNTEDALYDCIEIDHYKKDSSYFQTFQVNNDNKNADPIINKISLEINCNTNFAKNINISGSYDNKNWYSVGTDTVYNVDSKIKNDISLQSTCKYIFYKIEIINNAEDIKIKNMNVSFKKTYYSTEKFLKLQKFDFITKTDGKVTTVDVKGVKNLNLKDLTILSKNTFNRTVKGKYVSGEICNYNFNDVSISNMTLNINVDTITEPDLIFTINNNDDLPIKIDEINLNVCYDDVIFQKTDSKEYYLCYGDNTLTAPVYDVAKYKNLILKGSCDNCVLTDNIQKTDNTPIPKKKNYTLYFNLVVALVAVVLIFIGIGTIRKKA